MLWTLNRKYILQTGTFVDDYELVEFLGFLDAFPGKPCVRRKNGTLDYVHPDSISYIEDERYYDPKNTGHGWVSQRPDGVKVRCGGLGLCKECAREKNVLDGYQAIGSLDTNNPPKSGSAVKENEYKYIPTNTFDVMAHIANIKNREFTVHMLNDRGKERAKFIAAIFDMLLETIRPMCYQEREFSIVKTKLEEACFFAKKAMAIKPENLEFNDK